MTPIIRPRNTLPLPKAVRVIGITSEGSSNPERQIVLRINSNGHLRYFQLPFAELAQGDTKQLLQVLTETGHFDLIDRQLLKQVAKTILHQGIAKNVIVLTSNGWHEIPFDGRVHSVYTWFGKAYWFGEKPNLKVVIAHTGQPSPLDSCTLDEWKVHQGSKLPGNPYLIVTACHSLAAPLFRKFGQSRISLLLVGPSGVGKTTIQECAQSIIGPVEEVLSMSGTKVGILEHLSARPDIPAFFQDIRQIDHTDDLMDILFDVANGAGRLRGGNKLPSISSTLILSNERSITDISSWKRNSLDEGIHSRAIEIFCTAKFGAFHKLHNCETSDKFARMLHDNSRKYHSGVWPAWLSELSNQWPKVLSTHKARLLSVKSRIAELAGEAAYSRVNNRILDALSFSAWAGCIASKLKILPLPTDEIIASFGLVLKEQLSRQQSGSTPLAEQLIREVRGCLDENTSRFPALSSFNEDKPQASIFGYRTISKRHGDLYLFLPHVFDRFFKGKYGSVAYTFLEDRELLVTTNRRGNQFQARIPGTNSRKSFIAVKDSIRYD